ncbi:MAG: hypothetical protein AAGG08_19870, partial [Actinomycetota bacterium]
AWGPTTLPGEIVADLGFTRSETQSADGTFGFILVSEEALVDEVAADVVIGVPENVNAPDTIFDSPVVQMGETVHGVASEMWIANHAFTAWLVLRDVEALVLGDGELVSNDDLVDAWATFRSELAAA